MLDYVFHPLHYQLILELQLKQQAQQDLRSFDILTQAEQEHSKLLGPDPSKAATPEYLKYLEEIVNTLLAKRGTPKDQQIRHLLAEYEAK